MNYKDQFPEPVSVDIRLGDKGVNILTQLLRYVFTIIVLFNSFRGPDITYKLSPRKVFTSVSLHKG